MNKIINYIRICSLAFILISLLSSCGKQSRDATRQASKDNAIAEITFDDIMKLVIRASELTESGNTSDDCPAITITPAYPDTSFPKTLVINYGASGCIGSDGVLRSGIITAELSGKLHTPGTTATIVLDKYKRNGNLVKGLQILKNSGKNIYGHTVFNLNITDASVSTSDGGTSGWQSVRQWEWLLGEETHWPYINDDVFRVSGEAKGDDKDGNKFVVKILIPLRIQMDCRWISQGSYSLTVGDYAVRTTDFGNGNCDDEAILSYKHKKYTIVLD